MVRAACAVLSKHQDRFSLLPIHGLVIAVVVMHAAGCERVSSEYSTRADAAAAIRAGWVPEFIPASARHIREVHDLDSNHVCVRFELPAEDRDTLVASMRQLSAREIEGLSVRCRLGPGWWFTGRRQRGHGAGLAGDLYEVAVPAWDAPALVAVDRMGTSVFVWSR
jgi:hypothetical protein